MKLDPFEFLDSRDRETLKRVCDWLDVRYHTWRRVPMLRDTFEVIAVEAEADRVQARKGCGREPALREATKRLGIAFTTHRTRRDRAFSYSFDPTRDPNTQFEGGRTDRKAAS